MAMPAFTAESSLYRTSRSYRTQRHASGAAHLAGSGRSEVVAQQRRSFACIPDGPCACHGLQDCLDCGNLGLCTGHCECDIYGTCVCSG